MFKVIIRKTKTVINNPKSLLRKFMCFISPLLSTKVYLKLLYRLEMGNKLNLDSPVLFTEKLQWIKLYDRKKLYSQMVDKYEMKNFVSNLIGDEYIVENLGIWNSFDEIDFESLPDQFVLKTTHDQGGIVICKDKSKFDKKAVRKKLNKHLKRKHYYLTREWPYKNVKPRILAEKLLEISNCSSIDDFKVYTFNGRPEVMYIASGRDSKEGLSIDFFDMQGERLDIIQEGFNTNLNVELPKFYDKMQEISKILSKETLHLRVDFYEINDRLYIGELTFFDGGGLFKFNPPKWDKIFGDWIKLPIKNIIE